MYDLIVIGMGPAGMSSGIYAKRSGVNVLLLDGGLPGGLLNKISVIENYLGFPRISGSELSDVMFNHLKDNNIDYKFERVLSVNEENDNYIIITNKNKYTSKGIIVSSGRKQKKIGLENEDKYFGKGISYCSVCDAPLYKNKKLFVIGNNNEAFNESLFLKKFTDNITIISNSIVEADKELIDKVNESNIKIIENANINGFYGDDILRGISYNGLNEDADGVFIYVGYESDNTFLKKFDIFDENGYILVDENMKSSNDGIYACGDIIKKKVYQISTAVAEGTIAGINASKTIKKRGK